MGNIIAIGDGGGGPSTAVDTVTTFSTLPTPPSEGIGAERVTSDTGVLYIWDGTAWNAAAGGGSIVGGTNVGAGDGVFKNVSGANLVFKSLIGGTGITITSNTDDLTLDSTGVTSFNTRTGAVTLTAADVDGALGLGASNAFVFTDTSINLITYSDWSLDPVTQMSNVGLNYAPNNLGVSPQSFAWNVNIAPLQDSPNDSIIIQNVSSNLDSSAAGFNFGGNGQAATLLNGGYNYGGNGATVGLLRHVNFFSGLGNGTDPGTFQGFQTFANSVSVAANITVKGGWQGYDFNLNINSSAIADSTFNVLWLTDFSQIAVDTYGYQGLVCQPNISKIKNNHNFNGAQINPTIIDLEGNAGYFGYQANGTLTNTGASGVQGFNFNAQIASVPATANIIAFSAFNQITTMAATAQYIGNSISPTISTLNGGYTAFQSYPQITGAGAATASLYNGGMGQVTGVANPSVMNLNGLTGDNIQSQFAADNVHMNIGGSMTPTNSAPGGIQIQHVLFTSYDQTGAGTITGTDVLCNVLSPQVNFGTITDHLTLGPDGLGFGMVGFAGQTGGHGTIDLLSSVIPTAIFADDFTLGEFRNVNAYIINAGYSGVTTKCTAFYHEVAGAGLFAVSHWGLRVVTPLIENYVESMAFGTVSQKVTNPSVAIELGGNSRAFVNLNVTTTEKNALTALPGMQVFDTTLSQLSYYNGTTWVNL